LLTLAGCISLQAAAPIALQDYEADATPTLTAWVVNIPNENASVNLSSEQPQSGKHCLRLHYRFVDAGSFQYLGIPNQVKILAPVQKLRFWLKGDNSRTSYGVQLTDAKGETHQYSKSTGHGGVIDYLGWREIVVNLDSSHETWGGDKNGKLDYPLTAITFTIGQPQEGEKLVAREGDLYFDSLGAESDRPAEEVLGRQISVISPKYCSDIKGSTTVRIAARGFKKVTARCWKAGEQWGVDSTIATVALDENGLGSFVLPADAYPHGPITVRIGAETGTNRDNCYLQLYNRGGIPWNEGLPKDPPPPAAGMALVFADDFDGKLSISSTDSHARYYDHKPPGGTQDFSVHPFSGYASAKNPFLQVDTYLRIRASDAVHSAGLISSLKNDASGITAKAPCYFECRLLGPNAVGTWPAFWLMTDYMTDHVKGIQSPCDELDVIEAYGGEGMNEPNAFDSYMVTPHCWDQGEDGKALEKRAFEGLRNPIRMRKAGIPSAWFEAFHIYGCKITETDTIYYCDNIEVGRHATLPLSKKQPFFFLINLATGGGWPVDLSRYDGLADMYVDYVRVYAQADAGQ